MLSLKNIINERNNYQDKEYLECKSEILSRYEDITNFIYAYSGSLSVIDLLFYRKILPIPPKNQDEDFIVIMALPTQSILNFWVAFLTLSSEEVKDKLYSYNLSKKLEQDREYFYSYLKELSTHFRFMSEHLLNELNRVLNLSVTLVESNIDDFINNNEIEYISEKFINQLFYDDNAIYVKNFFRPRFYKWDLENQLLTKRDDETLNKSTLNLMKLYAKYIDTQFDDIFISLGAIFAYRTRKIILKEYWKSILKPISSYIDIHNRFYGNKSDVLMEYISQYNYNEILNIILKDVLEIISFLLGEDINITLEELRSRDEYNKISELWNMALEKVIKWPNITILDNEQMSYDKFLEKHKLFNQETVPSVSDKATNAIQNFLSSNAGTIIIKLKDSGLQLSASALQNDENISRVAGVIHNLLPAAIRFFVSYNTVENFLLNNRQWLINKLT